MQLFLNSEPVARLLSLHLPRYHELPALELYMDQVISVIDDALAPLFSEAQRPILTPTMINNYIKQKTVAPPVKKRYTRTHLMYFIVVALLKQVFSIAEIGNMIRQQLRCCDTSTAYDRFCTDLEQSFHVLFRDTQPYPDTPANGGELLRAAVLSLGNKIYVARYLEFVQSQTGADSDCSAVGKV